MNPKISGFSERLIFVRELNGLSQTDLAEKAGLRPSAISHFENNRRLPSYSNLFYLCRALNASGSFMLGLEDWNPQNELMKLRKKINALRSILSIN